MRIWIVSKRGIGLIILMVTAGIAAFGIYGYWAIRQEQATGYLIRQQYPPLVFVPVLQQKPKVSADAAVLIEVTSGAVLFAKNAEKRRAPASTTKIMTAVVALEKGNLTKVVKVSRRAAGVPGSTIWLRSGQQLVLKELLEGMMLCSGNDGSVAVAEGVAGSTGAFVRLMNLKARELGALQTNFRNPHGLRAPSHYTTAMDLALITRYALGNPRFANLVKTKTAHLEWTDTQKKVEIRNTNRLLWYLQGADGVKTGTTNEAGHCLVSSATRDGKKFIAVVLHSSDRWADCTRLLEYGLNNFSAIKLAKCEEPVLRLKVNRSEIKSVLLYPRRDLIAVVEKGTEPYVIKSVVVPKSPVNAPLRPGQVLGKLGYRIQGQFIEAVDLVNRTPVKRRWLWW